MYRLVQVSTAVGALALVACSGGGDGGGPPASLQLAITRPADLMITSLSLDVLEGASCAADGSASGGSVLPGLGGVVIVLDTPKTIKVSPGDRTFAVQAFDDADLVARGCARQTLAPGGTANVSITLNPTSNGDGGLADAGVGPDAGPPADAGIPDAALPDAAAPPPNDTCATATPLTPGTPVAGSTFGADDSVDLSCLAADSGDAFHVVDTTALGPRSLLVTLTPEAPGWDAALSLVPTAGCDVGAGALSCVPGGFAGAPRYINRPTLPPGAYDVVVDGDTGARGNYTVQADLAAADATFGYRIVESNQAYVELASGTTVPGFAVGLNSDEAAWSIALPFDFDYYGNAYNVLLADSNGFLTFGAVPIDQNAYTNDCPANATAPNDTISLFFDDGVPVYPTSVLRTEVQGVAPFRRIVIEYKDWDLIYFAGGSNFLPQGMKITQQVILFEDGDVEFRYGPRSIVDGTNMNKDCGPTRIFGCGATIGLENMTGTDVDGVQCNTASPQVAEGRVIHFVHPR